MSKNDGEVRVQQPEAWCLVFQIKGRCAYRDFGFAVGVIHAALPGAEGLSVDQASEVQATGESNSGESLRITCKLRFCQEWRLGRPSAWYMCARSLWRAS